jgi:hypothetical protein
MTWSAKQKSIAKIHQPWIYRHLEQAQILFSLILRQI